MRPEAVLPFIPDGGRLVGTPLFPDDMHLGKRPPSAITDDFSVPLDGRPTTIFDSGCTRPEARARALHPAHTHRAEGSWRFAEVDLDKRSKKGMNGPVRSRVPPHAPSMDTPGRSGRLGSFGGGPTRAGPVMPKGRGRSPREDGHRAK